MSEKYVPKHRNEPPRRLKQGARNAVYASGVAFFATGISVSAGVASQGPSLDGSLVNFAAGEPAAAQADLVSGEDLAAREEAASRSTGDRRELGVSLKAATFDSEAGRAVTKTEDLTLADPRTLARALMPEYGLDSGEFDCLDRIWTQESNWNVHADNPTSSAYGIPQALPGSKMATAGADWANNAETQIRWGLGYIEKRYGTACSAWSFKQGHGWY